MKNRKKVARIVSSEEFEIPLKFCYDTHTFFYYPNARIKNLQSHWEIMLKFKLTVPEDSLKKDKVKYEFRVSKGFPDGDGWPGRVKYMTERGRYHTLLWRVVND